jgi:hypothetical protein
MIATDKEIFAFELKYKLIIPEDLKLYFKSLESEKLTENDQWLSTFYDLTNFKTVKEEVGDFNGIPDYTQIVNSLPNHKRCFVFAEFMIHSSIWAIRLSPHVVEMNEVYMISGSNYKVVANSFTEFIKLYHSGSNDIY